MINKLIIEGRITRDIHVFSGGATTACGFSIANNQRAKDGEKTSFFQCVAFGKTAEMIVRNFQKGMGILIEGEIREDKYTNKDGETVRNTKIVIQNVHFTVNNNGRLPSEEMSDGERPKYDGERPRYDGERPKYQSKPAAHNTRQEETEFEEEYIDEDLPF